MGRLSREEEIKRRHKVVALRNKGYDHHQIAKEVGMRSQNVLKMFRWLDEIGEENIVTVDKQRETLYEASDKVMGELDRIDKLLEDMEYGKDTHSRYLELMRLKKGYLIELVAMWAIPATIEKTAKQAPSSVRAENMQINFDHLKSEEVLDATKDIVQAIDELKQNE